MSLTVEVEESVLWQRGASLEMLSPDRTQTRNGFAALDPEVSAPSSLGASDSRSDPEVHAPSSFCSVSLSGGFYLGFRSSELPPSSDHEAA
ncbi:unnamed protein product [Coregonus sp. 'balchen']|nr:unnamed protein product [Coregonus sp. 'balchen']